MYILFVALVLSTRLQLWTWQLER